MKRRMFLTASSLVGIGLGSGLAATSSVLFSNSPWHLNPDFNKEECSHFDHFAHEMHKNLNDTSFGKKFATKFVTPKQVISKKRNKNDYQIVYKNANDNYILLEKKGDQISHAVYQVSPK